MNKHNISSRILKVAESEMISCKHPYVGTEHLLLSLLKNKNIIKICDKYNLSYDKYKKELPPECHFPVVILNSDVPEVP